MWLIDADAMCELCGEPNPIKCSNCKVPQMGEVDAVPVVHGRWEEADDGDGVVCSVCREDFCNIYLEVDRFNYCPNCGAKMDLSE